MFRLLRIVGQVALFAAVVTVAGTQPRRAEAVRELGELVMMMGSLRLTHDLCIDLFPSQAEVIHGFYETSEAPSYAWLISQLARQPSDLDRQETLQSLGMSETEASGWCLREFPEMLDDFDRLYGSRSAELKAQFERLETTLATTPPATRSPPPPPNDERLTELFARIVEGANRAYETGDWSAFADLYEPNTFECWAEVPNFLEFGFLSMPPISPNATFNVTVFDYGVDPNNYAFTNVRPTHVMSISDQHSSPGGRCGLDTRQRWPRYDFFLVKREEEFALTHFCPLKETANGVSVASRRALSAAQTAMNVSQLSREDWEEIPRDVRGDPYSVRIHERLRVKYGLHYEEINAVVDHVCDPANLP